VNDDHLKTETITLDDPWPNIVVEEKDRIERILEVVKFVYPEIKTSIHIHTSSQRDYLLIKNLDIIELHSYHIPSTGITRNDLENPENKKKLHVGIAQTSEYDCVEPFESILKTAETAISKFGYVNILYMSSDCGLFGWKSQKKAELLWRRVSEATDKINEKYN
jgi:methionine synthase II (cobalamin-independent)